MATVNLKKKDGTYMDVEAGIKMLRRKMATEETMREYFDRRFYKSKGQKRRLAQEKADKKYKRKARKERSEY